MEKFELIILTDKLLQQSQNTKIDYLKQYAEENKISLINLSNDMIILIDEILKVVCKIDYFGVYTIDDNGKKCYEDYHRFIFNYDNMVESIQGHKIPVHSQIIFDNCHKEILIELKEKIEKKIINQKTTNSVLIQTDNHFSISNHLENQICIPEKKFQFDFIQRHLSTLTGNGEKLSYLLNLKLEYSLKYLTYNENFDKRFNYWKKTTPESIDNLITILEKLVKSEKSRISNHKTNNVELKFEDLFRAPEKKDLQTLYRLLKQKEMIDDKNHWIVQNDIRNEPAKVYFHLKDSKVIIHKNDTEGLKCFYNHFGLKLEEKNPEKDPRTSTLRNARAVKNTSDLPFLNKWYK